MEKKNNKLLLIIIISVIFILILGGAIFFFIMNNGKKDGKQVSFANPESITKEYINDIIEKDYNSALNCVYKEENSCKSCVTSDDYKNYLEQKDNFNLNGKIQKIESNISDDTATCTVYLKSEDKGTQIITIYLKKYNNNWLVQEKGLYLKDWKIQIPGDGSLYINGEIVDKKYISGKSGNFDVYTIPSIAQELKTFKVVTDIAESEKEITPTTQNDNYKMQVLIKDEELIGRALNFVKDTWNTMYKEYINGSDVSAVKNYFDSSIDINQINSYYKSSFDSLTKGSSGYKYVNYNMISIKPRDNENMYVSKNDVITLNFGYVLNWNWEFSEASNLRIMKRWSSIRLKIVGDSFKIYDVTDEKLFSYSNQYTKDF